MPIHASEFVIEKSGSYWLELTDLEGIRGGSDDRWEIRAVADAPPTVHIEQPTANLFVTARAVVPIRVSAKDDLAVRDISLTFRLAESGDSKRDSPIFADTKIGTVPDTKIGTVSMLPLFTGPARAPHRFAWGLDTAAPSSTGDHRVVRYRWDLGPLGLQPGMQVTFHAIARDYLPQEGKSEPRGLTVVTPDEMLDRISGREKLLVTELERALKMQRGSHSQVESLQVRLAEARKFEQPDVDCLQAAQQAQNDVCQLLTSRSEGVPMHILAILADLENNRIDDVDARRRMTALLEELDRLAREHLPLIGPELTAAVKATRADLEGREKMGTGSDPTRTNQEKTASDEAPVPIFSEPGLVTGSLADAGKHQDAVIASLEQWLGRLTQWDGFSRFHRELGHLLQEQEDVGNHTSDVGSRTLMRELRDLSPQDAADLKKTAARQLELARLLDRLLQELDQAGEQLRRTDPQAAETAANALEKARRLAISGQMNSAGGQIQQNQIGQATAGQKQIVRDLQEIVETLSHRGGQEIGRMEDTIKRLRERQENAITETKRLHGIEKSQGELTRAQASAVHDLSKSQREIQTDAARLGEQSESHKPIQLELAGVADDMGRAAESLNLRQTGPPTQEAQQSAIRRLDALLELIDQARKNAGQGPPGENQSRPDSPNGSNASNRTQPNSSDGSESTDKPSGNGATKPAGDGKVGKSDAAAETRARMKQLWGELPEHAREQMQQSAIEDFPPKYELRIEEYFRRLSEEKKR